MLFRKFKNKKKQKKWKRILCMWQKGSLCTKLQIKERCLTAIQRYTKKKSRTQLKKKWKNIDQKSTDISSTDSEDEEKSVSNMRNFEKYVSIDKRHAFVMIDSEALGNFILQQLIDKFKTITKLKKNSYNLMILNENSLLSNNEQILRQIVLVTLMINIYKKKYILEYYSND